MIAFPKNEEPKNYNDNPVLFWNWVGLEMNRLAHSISGPQTGPVLSASALGMLHLAIHDAYFALVPPTGHETYLNPAGPARIELPPPPAGADPVQAIAGAAVAVFSKLYLTPGPNVAPSVTQALSDLLNTWNRQVPDLRPNSAGFQYGVDVGYKIVELLAVRPGEPGVGVKETPDDPNSKTYEPRKTRFKFQDDPSHPVRVNLIDPFNPAAGEKIIRDLSHGPFYGNTALRFAVQNSHLDRAMEASHKIDLPPGDIAPNAGDLWVQDRAEYLASLKQLKHKGGGADANGTTREPDETVAALYWAYDGANLIGTPPRLYNQILRKLAWEKRTPGLGDANPIHLAEFARLFALANAAMGDAGIFSWREKYYYEFWRPLSGIRQHDTETGPKETTTVNGHEHVDELADPFWEALGAPNTNTSSVSFKPPFPAYPSGHATFGAACFQIARLFYKERDGMKFGDDEADDIELSFVSEELNGISRDLYQPYNLARPITDQPGLIRTRINRKFKSLWAMIYENAISRIYLGVHWRFDAFAAQDGVENLHTPNEAFKSDPATVKYVTTGAGGVQIGGVPLGLGIANNIFATKLKPTPKDQQPLRADETAAPAATSPIGAQRARPAVKIDSTNIR